MEKMQISRALELLQGYLWELDNLRTLNHDNKERWLWKNKVNVVLEAAFGKDSDEYINLNPKIKFGSNGINYAESQKFYLQDLDEYEKGILKILQKYEILEIEEKPLNKIESNGKVKSPIQLFDAMQLHSKVVEASKSCFITKNYREAILNAFISLIDYVKRISGLDLDGDDLMNNAFSFNYDKEQKKVTKYPIICINGLKDKTDRDEQQGFMYLCKGAAAFVRNPKAHKLIVQTNPLHTLEYLAFSSMLFKQLDIGAEPPLKE